MASCDCLHDFTQIYLLHYTTSVRLIQHSICTITLYNFSKTNSTQAFVQLCWEMRCLCVPVCWSQWVTVTDISVLHRPIDISRSVDTVSATGNANTSSLSCLLGRLLIRLSRLSWLSPASSLPRRVPWHDCAMDIPTIECPIYLVWNWCKLSNMSLTKLCLAHSQCNGPIRYKRSSTHLHILDPK